MRTISSLVLPALWCLLACGGPSTPFPVAGIVPSDEDVAVCAQASFLNPPVISSYWLPGTFDSATDNFWDNWYSTQLCAMGEVPLSPPAEGGARLRLLWLRSFHPGVAVRIEHHGDRTDMVAVELGRAGGYEPGTVARRIEKVLSAEEWQQLRKELARLRYWRLPTNEEVENVIRFDGSHWVVEVAEPDRYHVVDRWGGGELEPLGRLLLELSQLEPDPIY